MTHLVYASFVFLAQSSFGHIEVVSQALQPRHFLSGHPLPVAIVCPDLLPFQPITYQMQLIDQHGRPGTHSNGVNQRKLAWGVSLF